MRIDVRPGTDTRYPSVRVKIGYYPVGQAGLNKAVLAHNAAAAEVRLDPNATRPWDPDNPPAHVVEKYSSRQIALVFRHGESEAEMREAIDQAVSEYMDRQAVTAPETPAAVLGERDVA